MVRAAVDRPLLQDLGDDLPDALAAHAFLSRNLLVARALAQAREDPLPPPHLADRPQMPAQRRCLLNHSQLSVRERFAALRENASE
jgi:hypothetical protein